jgi:hypothetical protein
MGRTVDRNEKLEVPASGQATKRLLLCIKLKRLIVTKITVSSFLQYNNDINEPLGRHVYLAFGHMFSRLRGY